MQQNKQQITQEFAKDKKLLFLPETGDEAAYILGRFSSMGYTDTECTDEVRRRSVQRGLIFAFDQASHTHRAFYGPGFDGDDTILCEAAQLEENDASPAQTFSKTPVFAAVNRGRSR